MFKAKTLTDFEAIGLGGRLNLADGHAYQELAPGYAGIIEDLSETWRLSTVVRVPEAEQSFRASFAALARSPTMAKLPFFKVCPTASSSIDVIGAILSSKGLRTTLVEPTFDNLSLLLRRRGVLLEPISEIFTDVSRTNTELDAHIFSCGGALVVVQPSNPTGRSLQPSVLQKIAMHCAEKKKLLVMDNSFRFYNRELYDDYAVLKESGTSFLAFEDTGKFLPTHDLKASLLFCSPDLEGAVNDVYNETYLCISRFVLKLLEQLLWRTLERGLEQVLWPIVDQRRFLLRENLAGTGVVVDPASLASNISVEWLDCRGTGLRDLELTALLAESGVLALPGRLFFWSSGAQVERHYNVRMALMKPEKDFMEAINVVGRVLRERTVPVPGLSNTTHLDDLDRFD